MPQNPPADDDVVDRYRTPRALLFHRLCLIGVLILAPLLTFGRWAKRSAAETQPIDITQYYLGGRMVLTGHPEALYPIPHEGSKKNPGFQNESELRPAAAAEAKRLNIRFGPRFIQPPPSAPLFVPLALLSPTAASVVWLAILCASQIGIGLIAAAICRRCGGSDVAADVIFVAASLAPAGLQAQQFGNLSPLVGFLVGLNLLLLLKGRQVAAGAVFTIGLALKYWNIALVPVHLARRQYLAAVSAVVVGVALLVLSLFTIGVEPYRVYSEEIAPLLTRSFGRDNHSLYGYFIRRHGDVLTERTQIGIEVGRWIVFAGLVTATALGRRAIARSDSAAVGFAAAWLGWVFVFSPIFWGHYASVIMPVWGWLAAVVWRERGWSRYAAAFAIIATSFFPPLLGSWLNRFPDPWSMHMSAALLVMAVLALRELREPAKA